MTLNRLASAAALSLALTGTAFAADLPIRSAPPPFVPPPPPLFTWTGFYAGLNAGAVFDQETHFRTFNPAGALIDSRKGFDDSGFTGGGQIGYNYEFPMGNGSGIVVGLEADAMYTDLNSGGTVNPNANFSVLNGQNLHYHSDMDFLGTARGRLGYAFNNFLIYGTGGFAYGDVNNRIVRRVGVGGPVTEAAGYSDFSTGYTYGGGVEYALPTNSFLNFFHSSAVTLRVEYLHYDLGDETVAYKTTAAFVGPAGAADGASAKFHNEGDIVRAGINYKF